MKAQGTASELANLVNADAEALSARYQLVLAFLPLRLDATAHASVSLAVIVRHFLLRREWDNGAKQRAPVTSPGATEASDNSAGEETRETKRKSCAKTKRARVTLQQL